MDGATGPVRRVGLIGDVHAEDVLLARAIAHLKRKDPDAILCVGDITDGFDRERGVDRCCALLRAEGVRTVTGNHDRWCVDQELRDLDHATLSKDLRRETLQFLNTLPTHIDLATVAGRAILCHGLEGDDMGSVKPLDRGTAISDNRALQAMLAPRRYDFVLNGHTHQRMVRTIEGLTIINAGTLRRDHQPGCVLVDFAERNVQCFDLGADDTIVDAATLPLTSS